MTEDQKHHDLIARAIEDIVLERGLDIASYGLQEDYFVRLFKQRTGITPAQLKRYVSLRQAQDFLLKGYTTLEAAYAAGLSGQGRLHEGLVTYEAAAPGELKSRGKGVTIAYGRHATSFGYVDIARTDKGVCWIGFAMKERPQASLEKMLEKWPNATFQENITATKDDAHRLDHLFKNKRDGTPLKLHLFGTNFQIKVWEALLRIPAGGTVSYGAIAENLGNAKASRAVGGAVGANPISWVIPCHRVIQASGIVENYASGTERKCALLALENH